MFCNYKRVVTILFSKVFQRPFNSDSSHSPPVSLPLGSVSPPNQTADFYDTRYPCTYSEDGYRRIPHFCVRSLHRAVAVAAAYLMLLHKRKTLSTDHVCSSSFLLQFLDFAIVHRFPSLFSVVPDVTNSTSNCFPNQNVCQIALCSFP